MLIDQLNNSYTDCFSAIPVGIGQNNNEFIATDATDNVGLPHTVFEDFCKLNKQLVTGLMAEGIINFLKVIQIQKQQRTIARIAFILEAKRFDIRFQPSAIDQSCQGVMIRQMLHKLDKFLTLGYIDNINE